MEIVTRKAIDRFYANKRIAEAGIRTLWMHEQVMKGVRNPKAIFLCEENGIECITGFCPMMFLPKTGLQHKLHGTILKLFGAYPA